MEEELRVLQAGLEDSLVAAADNLFLGRVGVLHHQESVGKIPLGVLGGEIALVLLHGGYQDLARQVGVFLGEGSHQDVRPLRQVDHLVHQFGRGDGLEASLSADPLHLLEDQFAPALL